MKLLIQFGVYLVLALMLLLVPSALLLRALFPLDGEGMLKGIWIVPWDGVAALATVGVAFVGQRWAKRVRDQDLADREAARRAEEEEKRLVDLRRVYLPLWDALQNLRVACDDWIGDYSSQSQPELYEKSRAGSPEEREVARRIRELKLFIRRSGAPASEVTKEIVATLVGEYESTQWIRGLLGGQRGGGRPKTLTPIELYGTILPSAVEAARRQMAEELGPRSPI